MLKIFERHGMIVNAKKTKAVLMTTGKDKGKTHKHYVRTSGDGKKIATVTEMSGPVGALGAACRMSGLGYCLREI